MLRGKFVPAVTYAVTLEDGAVLSEFDDMAMQVNGSARVEPLRRFAQEQLSVGGGRRAALTS